MPTIISTAQEFKAKVKDVKRDQLLIFHSRQSNPARVNRFNIVALAVAVNAGKPVEVLTSNLDVVKLDAADAALYQLGKSVITCTTINDGVVMEKATEPFESTLSQMVRNILG